MGVRKFVTTMREYLNEQQENIELYHGSDTNFNTFDDSLISSGEGSDLFGKGYYFTNDKKIADFYANLKTKKSRIKNYNDSGIFKTQVPIYNDDADEYASKNKNINTFTIKGNILNSEEFVIDENFKNYIINSYVKHTGFTKETAIRVFDFMKNNKNKINNFRGELEYILTQLGHMDNDILNDIIKYIKSIGYDGVKYRPNKDFDGDGDYWNYVIYNKNIIVVK